MDATYQDAYLRIKYKVLFSLTYICKVTKFLFSHSHRRMPYKPCGMNKEGKEDSHVCSIMCFKGLKAKHRKPSSPLKSRGKRDNVTLLDMSQLKCTANVTKKLHLAHEARSLEVWRLYCQSSTIGSLQMLFLQAAVTGY